MKTKSLFLSAIFTIAGFSMVNAQLASDSKIVAQWKFDEGTGTTAADTKGVSNGTVTTATWVDGKVGKALNFAAGLEANVKVPDNVTIDFSTASSFTFSVLMQVTNINVTADMNFIWKGATGKTTVDEKGRWYGMLFKSNQLRLAVDDDIVKTQLGYSNANLKMDLTGGWNHIVGVRDRTAGKLFLYINKEMVAEMVDGTVQEIASTPLPLIIGNNNALNRNFEGSLDELTMYNAALTAAEITELYNFYFATNGIENLQMNGINILTEKSKINITAENAANVKILSLEGKTIASQLVQGSASFSTKAGMYIVSVNNKTVKVIVY